MNFSWQIVSLETKDQTNDEGATLQNAVVRVVWKRVGTDSEGVSHTFLGNSWFSAESTAADDFIPYFDLTESNIISWIETKLTAHEVGKIDDIITNRINKKNTIVRTPHWS